MGVVSGSKDMRNGRRNVAPAQCGFSQTTSSSAPGWSCSPPSTPGCFSPGCCSPGCCSPPSTPSCTPPLGLWRRKVRGTIQPLYLVVGMVMVVVAVVLVMVMVIVMMIVMMMMMAYILSSLTFLTPFTGLWL